MLCAQSCGVDEAGETPSQSAGLGAYLAAGALVDLIAPDIGKAYCHERVPLHPVDRTIVSEVRQVAETEPSDDLIADGVVPVTVASKAIHVRARCLNHLVPLHPQDGGAGPAKDAVVQAVNGRIESTENKRCVGQQLIERLVRLTAACVRHAPQPKPKARQHRYDGVSVVLLPEPGERGECIVAARAGWLGDDLDDVCG
jgi:hypothetical protein